MILIISLTAAAATTAEAHPRQLPFTYGHATMPAGGIELEQYVDLIPMRVVDEQANGSQAVSSTRYELQTEIEAGLTDWLEAGWYFVFRQGASARGSALAFHGVKQRLRAQLAEAGEWPVDIGVYFEVAELTGEVELEQKLIVSKRFGRLSVLANLWVEEEYYFNEKDWKYLYNPTAGVTYELSPAVTTGLEYWARGRFDDLAAHEDKAVAGRTHHYVGPTLLGQRGEVWLCAGAYVRADNLGERIPAGDPWGRVWVRTLLGIGL
jgi:hypothetical protein